MHILSKLLHFGLNPLAWVALMLGLAVLQPRQRAGWTRGLSALALALLLGAGWVPLPDLLLRALENEAVAPDPGTLGGYRGIVVLGGALDAAYISAAHSEPALNAAAERMTTTLALWRRQPQLQIVFSGGEGELSALGPTESQRARQFFIQQGADVSRILFESKSRNTWENAQFSAGLPGVDPHAPWLLVTSAAHMPRALAAFRKAGWNVTPWPTDYRTGAQTPWLRYSLSESTEKWESALSEYVGLAIYRLLGRA